MPIKNDRYTYRVIWSEDDKENVGLCVEFPSLSWLAGSPEAALRGIRRVVEDVIQDMERNGEPPPEPLSGKKFSGRFVVRIPPIVHRKLSVQAKEEGVSLNRLVSSKLSQ